MSITTLQFSNRGHKYGVTIVDEGLDNLIDPTVAIFRDLEEEPIAVIHLNPDAPCEEARHTIVTVPEQPQA